MKYTALDLPGVYTIELEVQQDTRGAFMRTYCKKEFAAIGFQQEFVQMNHSINKQRGTVRGLHVQLPPFAECKLIRCIRGAVFDVVVDLRHDSPTFLQWRGVELSQDNERMILIPEGCAHGFQTLLDDTEMLYHHTSYYEPESECTVNFFDPRLDIHLPLSVTEISDKDQHCPFITPTFEGVL